MKWLFLFAFIGINGITTYAQSGILFQDLSIEAAIQLAKESKKNVFVDTYADWCIPCKKMEQELKREDMVNFFNENYINVRINMDHSVHAESYKKNYDIVFLPTLILIDGYGNIKYKTDKAIPADELLLIAKKSLNANVYFLNEATDIIRDPMSPGSQSSMKGKEVIVHKLGAPNQNPDIMYKEAYFRIELMDGSHRKTAVNYLETQTDWSIPKNMRFILDFIYSTKSAEFQYMVNHIDKFKERFGEEEIIRTLSFLINDELLNGYPRPTYEEAIQLFTYLDPSTAEKQTMQYFMDRYLDECNFLSYKNIAKRYLLKYSDHSAEIYAAIGMSCTHEPNNGGDELQACIDATKKAVELHNIVPFYYEQLAQLYLLKKDKKQALKALQKAHEMAKLANHNLSYYEKLKKQIEN